jgi:hypothetical protein
MCFLCFSGQLVLGCFVVLGFGLSAGCVFIRRKKSLFVLKRQCFLLFLGLKMTRVPLKFSHLNHLSSLAVFLVVATDDLQPVAIVTITSTVGLGPFSFHFELGMRNDAAEKLGLHYLFSLGFAEEMWFFSFFGGFSAFVFFTPSYY